MRRSAWQIRHAIAALAMWLPSYASGSCAGPASFCEKLPDRDNMNSAIFAGTVVQVRAQVVRFQVTETFLHAPPGEFELSVTSDLYVDGVPRGGPAFGESQAWLVEATRRGRDQPWTTSNCLRTKALPSAAEDLRTLRAWVAGRELPARVSGEVWDPVNRKNIPGIRVNLTGGTQVLSTVSDATGQFAFDGLTTGQYQAVALLPGGAIERELDLTRAWCVRVVFLPK